MITQDVFSLQCRNFRRVGMQLPAVFSTLFLQYVTSSSHSLRSTCEQCNVGEKA